MPGLIFLPKLSEEQKFLRQKIFQSNRIDHVITWKKERAILQRKIKIRQAEIIELHLKESAEQLNNQAAHQNLFRFMERLMRKPKDIGKSPSLNMFTDHYRNCFSGDDQPIIPKGDDINYVTIEEVASVKSKLKNRRAPGPDGLTSEDMKKMKDDEIADTLNDMLINQNNILTHGYIMPILKPNKNRVIPESYRPVILLSAWRKLLSLIVLRRIDDQLEQIINRSQHAYSKNKSSGDVILTHKLLFAASVEKDFNPSLVGVDMSNAFDTVRRKLLLDLLNDVISPGNLKVIEILLTNTTLAVKFNTNLGNSFPTTRGVPQGDSLSPKLFNFYVNSALTRIDNIMKPIDHNYSFRQHQLPLHIEYADDIDFIITDDKDPKHLINVVKSTFAEYNLQVNDTKTEYTHFGYGKDLTKVKKLGSLLDDERDMSQRNILSFCALRKFDFVWKNPFIKIPRKLFIYQTFVKPIFQYNSSTWISNKRIENKLDVFQRKHLRYVLNIFYPKKIHNKELYKITNCQSFSESLRFYRKRHLGHLLRRESTFKDVLRFVETLPRRKRGPRPPTILKTYRKDFGTDNWLKLEDLAFARTI